MSSFPSAGPERGASASAVLVGERHADSAGCRGSGLSRLWAWDLSGRFSVVVVVVLVGLMAACSDDESSVVESSAAASLPETTVTTLVSVSTSSTSAAPSSTTTAAAAGLTAVPGGGSRAASRAIAPLRLDGPDDVSGFLSEMSDDERSCLEENGIGPGELSLVSGDAPGAEASERTALVIGCLQEETLLRLFLTSLVGLTDPLTPETSACVREALVSIDLHRLLSPPAAQSADPVNSLGLGMAALNVSVVCMNDEEWGVYAPRLGMRAEDRESLVCLLERLGGPEALVEAMLQASRGEPPEALGEWLEACAPETSPPAAADYGPGSGGGFLIWSFATGGWELTGPVVVDGVAYFGTDDANLYALLAQSGELVWSFSAAAGIRSVPAVSDGRVYFGAGDNHLYALDAATGTELWRHDTGRPIPQSPTVAGGLVYIPARAAYDVAVHAQDAATGTVVWVAEQPYPTDERLAPTAHGGRVYAQGAEYGTFYVLDAATGQTIWQAEVAGYVESVPTVVDGVVYLTVINQAYAFDEATGELIWQTNTQEFPARDFPALVTDGVYYLAPAGHVHALDAATGQKIWSHQIEPGGTLGLSTAPVVAGGTLFAASETEHLFALDAQTGELLWTLPTNNSTSHALSVVDGVLYGQRSDGYLFGVDTADPNNGHTPPWLFKIGWSNDTPKYSTADGIVYSTGPDGRFYAHTTPATT
ncbi:MAG: PQQ-binding-like beta-propeller repeat protein [Acidimicrobiia bacterium]|nr:PQQ-binding-like beta-propeller repeat protein [Acidimicrobiia bacterium]